MSGLLPAADHIQLGTPNPFVQLGPLKCDNWKNGYIAVTQPHVDRLHSNITKWYSGTVEAAEL